jgi:ribosomal protein S18 acetylase RimI-like enzyme
MPTIQIREFRYPTDYDRAIDLWSEAGEGIRVGPSDSPSQIQKKLERDSDLFLVAESGDRLVGTVIGGFDGRRGFVYHLAVAETFRRIGIATRLMDEIEHRLRLKGCIRSYLLVLPTNIPAMRHYEDRGWSRTDDLVYAKDLGG